MYDLIVTKQKNKQKKLLVILLIIFIFLVIFLIIGINKINIANNKSIEVVKMANVNIDDILKIKKDMEDKNRNKNKEPLTIEQLEAINNIYSSDSEKRVFLTFDDGPSKSVTPLILDLLKQENIKATFFVLGNRVEQNPEIINRIFEEGHYIANHGYSHVYSSIYTSIDSILDEYNKTEQCIKNALNNPDYNSRVFRFPGGSVGGKYHQIKNDAKEVLKQNNIAYLDWNALSNDSFGSVTREDIMKNITETVGTKNSVVILMHDGSDKILTYETLLEVINYLRNQGYQFKNLYDIL